MAFIIVSAVLAAALLVTAFALFAIKREMRQIKRELELNRSRNYNRMLTVSLFDRDLTDMAAEMNRSLAYQKQLKLQAEQAEHTLKQAVSDIAHDLRTPLTIIKGSLQLLEADEKLSPRDKEQLCLCMKKSDEMKQMADDFFELAMLESDSSPANPRPINLTNQLVQLLVDNEAVIRMKGLSPEVVLPESSVFALADEKLLQRMLENLLNNVLKYADGSFTAGIKQTSQGRCRVCFSNEVSGALPDARRLFERTYRADKSRSGSAGLGLHIVKLLAQKQDMSVGAELNGRVLSLWVEMLTAK